MNRDVMRFAALAGYTAILLAPLRHYCGPMKKVNEAKFAEDSFPLSTYPMFSEDRKGRVTVPHIVGITADGSRVLPHYRHFGAGGLNQVRKQVAKALRDGRASAIAQTYADSLARRPRTEAEKDIVEVRVVRSRFLFDDYFAGNTHPKKEVIHARCAVGGTAQPEVKG